MGLMERVSTLIRANVNDVIDRAEHPEKMIKQLILDMENQLIQVKTQVAVAIADQHMLGQKHNENERLSAEWMQKAELAVQKGKDDLARGALDRYQNYHRLGENFKEQVADQAEQVEILKEAFRNLEQKLVETKAKSQILIAQHRRARSANKAHSAHAAMRDGYASNAFDRMREKVAHETAITHAKAEMAADSLEDRFAVLQRDDEIETLLSEIKARHQLSN